MQKTEFVAAALVALAFTACSKEIPADDIAIDNDAASPMAGGPPEGVDAPNSVTVAAENAATEAGKAAAKLPTRIPQQYRGRWGLTKVDCSSTKGDAKGLLTIDDTRLNFYESRGKLDKVVGGTANSFDASYEFSGEGQEWQRVERLTRTNAKLQRHTDAPTGHELPVNQTYSRCGG